MLSGQVEERTQNKTKNIRREITMKRQITLKRYPRDLSFLTSCSFRRKKENDLKKKRGNIKQMILENFPHLKTDLHLQIKEVAEFKLRSVGKDTPKHI